MTVWNLSSKFVKEMLTFSCHLPFLNVMLNVCKEIQSLDEFEMVIIIYIFFCCDQSVILDDIYNEKHIQRHSHVNNIHK